MKKCFFLFAAVVLFAFNVFSQNALNGLAHSAKNPTVKNFNYKSPAVTQIQPTAQSKQVDAFMFESFEGSFPPAGWTKQNPDGGTGWAQLANGTTPLPGWNGGTQTVPTGGGNKVAYCTYNTGGLSSNDQWLITPQFSVLAGDSLKFSAFFFGAYKDSLFVLLSTTTNSPAAFTTTLMAMDTMALTPMSSWHNFKINLTPYAGQNVYVAFREKIADNVNDGAYFALDLVSMGTPLLNNVATTSIDVPAIVGAGLYTPKATVQNMGSATQTFDVTMNIGAYTSTKTVTALASMTSQQVSFDPWTAPVGLDTIEVYTSLAGDQDLLNDTLTQPVSVMVLTKAYCYIAYDASGTTPVGPAYTYLQAPNMITSLADQSTMQFIAAGAWGYNNKWYGAVYGDNNLVTLDTLTGARTVIGNIGVSISGMTYDAKTNKLYGVAWNGTNSSLYTINYASGAATLVGACDTALLINLACDTAGNLYAVSITGDKLFSIDKNTGVNTVIGPIGFNAAYAQDMEFDRVTNTCYMASYNGTSGAGELRTVNTSTGATTLIGSFLGGAEITGFAIPFNVQMPTNDAGVIAVTSPKSECGLGNEDVTVTVFNFGGNTLTDLPVSYRVGTGTVITDTIPTLAGATSITHTFTTQANLSTAGTTYAIKAYTSLLGDIDVANDTTNASVTNVANAVAPYSMGFEPAEDMQGWAIENTNGDAKTWFISTTGGNTGPYCAEYSYNSASAADDWLISKCISLTSGITYKLSFYYKAASGSFPEKLMVHIGNAPVSTALVTMLDNLSNIITTTYVLREINFSVLTTGVYYIGWKCYSAADMFNLYVDDINLVDATGINETALAAAIDVYPNPAQDNFTVKSSQMINKIKVMNAMGAVVYDQLIQGNKITINTSEFSNGIYFVQIETGNGSITKKIQVIR